MNKSVFRWTMVGASVLWVLFVSATFFGVQKPFSTANAAAVGNVLLDLLVTGWLALVALALGVWLLRWFLPSFLTIEEKEGKVETLVLGTGLGIGVLGLLSLGLGLAGLFRPAVAYGVTLALSVALFPQLISLFHRWRHWRPHSLPNLLTALFLSLTALWSLLVALLPPTDWDGLFYHLTGPKLYLQAGGVTGGIDIPHLNFPSLMEMLYAWAMLLRGDIAAKLLHTLFGLLLGGLVYLTARCLLKKEAAWPSVLIYASMPMVGTLAGWAYNDLALAFFQLASLYVFVKYQIGRATRQQSNRSTGRQPGKWPNLKPKISNPGWLVLSGIFAGLAMGLKYTSFVTPIVIIVLILWQAIRHRSGNLESKTLLLNLALFSLSALVTALPWYAKNWAFTDNPVYPFLFGLFNGRYWDGFRADWYAAAGTGIGWHPTTLLALPWLLTLGVRDMNYWDGRTGPLLLLFLPLILLYGLVRYRRQAPDRPAALDSLLVYALAQFAFWSLGVVWSRSLWQSRLLLPCLVALAPIVGWLWTDMSRFELPSFSLSRFVNVAIGLALVLILVDTGLLTLRINPLPYLVGEETQEEYLTRRLGAHYVAMQQINDDLAHDAVVVFLWEPRSYYCQRDCRPDSILDEFPHMVYKHGSADAIAQAWQQAGVTHLLIHRSGLNFVLSESPAIINTDVLNTLESKYLRQVFDVVGVYQLYTLQENP